MQTTNVTPPQVGTHVFGSDGEEIGTISDVQSDYFQVKKGTLFRKEVYLPLTAITGTALGGDGVTVNLTKDEVESGDWSSPPAAGFEAEQTPDTDVPDRP
jgi:uncharacterized protein YrrD